MNWLGLLGLDVLIARCRVVALEAAIAAEDRLELARLEWRAQKRLLQQLVALSLLLAALGLVVSIMLSAALLIQFWDTPYRLQVAWGIALGWLLIWGAALGCWLRLSRQVGEGFALTRAELSKDWRDIKESL